MLKKNYYSRDEYERHKRLKHEYRSFNDVRVDDPTLPQRIRNLILNDLTKNNQFLQSFLPSILEQFEKKGYLTQKQVDLLEKNEKQFDPMNVESARKDFEEWTKECDDQKRETAKKVAEYYRKEYESGRSASFYYEKVATQILSDPDYIPSRQQYEKMVQNKYAQQWLKNSSAKPKFAVGDYVSLNSQTKSYWNGRNYGGDFRKVEQYEVATVIQVKPPQHNRQGAHIYVLLPMGGEEVVEIEERFLKKAKGM
jgi:hypothetical protein